jgi:hypothetical protein
MSDTYRPSLDDGLEADFAFLWLRFYASHVYTSFGNACSILCDDTGVEPAHSRDKRPTVVTFLFRESI